MINREFSTRIRANRLTFIETNGEKQCKVCGHYRLLSQLKACYPCIAKAESKNKLRRAR